MQEFVSQANIEKYRKLLAGTLDAATRKEIERQLAEELAKRHPPNHPSNDIAEIVEWDADSHSGLVLHSLVAHDTAMLLGNGCGLRLSLARRHSKQISETVQVNLTVDQAQALINDLQLIVDWTRLSPAERKARAIPPETPKKTESNL